MLVWVYTCQNATLLEITCHGSYLFLFFKVHWMSGYSKNTKLQLWIMRDPNHILSEYLADSTGDYPRSFSNDWPDKIKRQLNLDERSDKIRRQLNFDERSDEIRLCYDSNERSDKKKKSTWLKWTSSQPDLTRRKLDVFCYHDVHIMYSHDILMPISTQLNEHCNIPYYKDYLKMLSYKYNMFVWTKYPKVANQHQTETPERAGGRTKMNSDCDQFQL